MKHSMKLQEDPYERISSGKKTIEIRLFDEKRQVLNLGDEIEFSLLSDPEYNIKTKIIGLLRYTSFRDLIEDIGVYHLGYDETLTVEDILDRIYIIYSKEQEEKYGVLGIKIELIKEE